MASLYEIDRTIESILERMFAEVDEETGEVSQGILDELDQMQAARAEKFDNIGAYIKNLEAEAAAIKTEMNNLKERLESKLRHVERLKEYVANSLLSNGEKKMETPRVAFSFRSSERVEIIDKDQIPKKYMVKKVTFDPDKTEIKNMLKSGHKIKGCELVQRQNLQIK